MPGTKNSGRKKKVHDDVDIINAENEVTPPEKKKPGRPKKTLIEKTDDFTFPQPIVDKNNTNESQLQGNKNPLARISTNISSLSSRKSELNKFYDVYVGPPLEQLPKKNLPIKRAILQRYRAIRSKSHNMPQRAVASIISNEVIELWDCSAIPRKDTEACIYSIQKVISYWVDSKQEEKVSHLFQENLNTLLDLRPSFCSTLPALKKELQTLVGENWEEDYIFFKGQLKYPQDGLMSPTTDHITEAKKKRRADRELKANVFKEKNSTRTDDKLNPTRNVTEAAHMLISEENILR